MDIVWFLIVGVMVIVYAVLDGFDLGAGAVQWFVGRTSDERELVRRAIGPMWDGNEVWLIAAGGTLYFAFPAVYASSFSGFYLPLMIVLWLLMLRGIGIEVRGHLDDPLWHSFFDAIFAGASVLLAIFFGAALGNVIRGVPLGADGYFFEPLWTTFTITESPGILDWFTVLTGVLTLTVLVSHGAHFIALRTRGAVRDRAVRIANLFWGPMLGLSILGLVATLRVRPEVLDNYVRWPVGWLIPAGVVAAAIAMPYYRRTQRDLAAFLASSLFIALMLGGAAFALYPLLLPSSNAVHPGLTTLNTLAPAYGLSVGLRWWSIAFVLALGYFAWIYRSLGIKIDLDERAA
jgi:cytochrome d ubiquinol oxidase subunit II